MTVFFDYILGELRLKDTSGGGGGSAGSLEAIQIDQSGGTSDTYGVLSGTINGSNTLFTVSKSEYITGSLRVFLNGQLQTQGSAEDWVETTPASGTFTFNTAPQTGDEITVAYNYPATATIDSLVVNNLSVNSTASINVAYFNGIYASTISTGNFTTNNLAVTSLASINHIRANSLIAATATLGLTHISTIDWNLTSGATVTQEGQMNWDANQQTAVIGMAGGNVDLALGMETLFPRRVKNSTATTMPKGSVVYINGVSGNDPTVDFAIATGDMTSAFTLGMTAEDITAGQKGWVATFGELTGINLSSFTGGDTLYLSGATAGLFTNVPQKAPYHYVRVGTVVKATTDGALVVNVINGYELNELHNVAISSLASGQILQSGVSSLWYNRSLASAVADLNVLASLGSLAYQNTVDYVTQVTSKPSLGSLAVLNELSYGSLLSAPSLSGEYLRLDLTNTLTGTTLNFDGVNSKVIAVSRTSTSIGKSITLQAGAAQSGGTNLNGGNLNLISGVGTGTGSSDIVFNTVTGGTSGTTDRNPTEKMRIKGSGNVGIGTTTPTYKLAVAGTGNFTGDLTANNLSGTNTGDVDLNIFGDGSDGVVYFDGSSDFDFATYDAGTYTYTLTRDIYASSILVDGTTVLSTVTVKTGGYRIFSSGDITISSLGVIDNSGTDAVGRTNGIGGTGGFFKAGGNGTIGLSTAQTGNGTAPTVGTNVVGGLGGRGAAGRAALTGNEGLGIDDATIARPATAIGGTRIVNHITSFLIPFIPSGAAANIQFQPSIGGGAGAKSAAGTAATSGGGGGGGGVVFLATPILNNNGVIRANGGIGGDAAGTNGNFGGGGGGGGGVVGIVTKSTNVGTVQALGGAGGQSITGTNGDYPIGIAQNSVTGTTALTLRITPTELFNKNSMYMLSTVCVGGEVQSVEGQDMGWGLIDYVLYNTIASPTRELSLWYGTWSSPQLISPIDFPQIKINLTGTPTSIRVMIDEIQNLDLGVIYAGSAKNSSDSTTNLTVDLGYVPATGNLQYSVFGRVGGTTPVVGTGNTVLNNQNVAPFLYSSVATGRQTNNHTWTTATAAAGITVDIPTNSGTAETGSAGWDGKVIILN